MPNVFLDGKGHIITERTCGVTHALRKYLRDPQCNLSFTFTDNCFHFSVSNMTSAPPKNSSLHADMTETFTVNIAEHIYTAKAWKKDFSKATRELFTATKISRFCFQNVPKRLCSYRNARELPIKCRKALVKAADKCLRKICSLILRQDGDGLYDEFLREKCVSNSIVHGMIKALTKTKKGTVEKRILRACLFAHLPGEEVQRLIADSKNIEEYDMTGVLNENMESENDEEDGEINKGQVRYTGNSERGVGTEVVLKSVNSGAFCRARKFARDDWLDLLNDGHIMTIPHGRKIFNDVEILQAVKFMLRSDNVQRMSWGTKCIRLDGVTKKIPAVHRRMSAESIWRRYCKEPTLVENTRKLGCSSFKNVLRLITKGEVRIHSCIDYILNGLIYENFCNVKEMVKSKVRDVLKQKDCVRKLDAAVEFLKYSYGTHLTEDDWDPLHDLTFSLLSGRGTDKRSAKCRECLSVFAVLNDVEKCIADNSEEVEHVLRDCADKVLLYMGHIHRSVAQSKRIGEIMTKVKEMECGEGCVAFLDYKMKLEPIRYRESTAQFFGKRGMSWHGSGVFYKTDGDSNARHGREIKMTCGRSKRRGKLDHVTGKNGKGEQRAQGCGIQTKDELGFFFVDHIAENDNVQDCIETVSIVEALMFRIKRQLPKCRQLWIVTDNARCYKNDLFSGIVLQVCKQRSITLKGIIHPAAQDGKNMVDAHFAIAKRHVLRYIAEQKADVIVPEDIVKALTYDHGLPNSVVDFINVDRSNHNLQRWGSAKKEDISSLGAVGEIVFERKECGEDIGHVYQYSSGPCTSYRFMPFETVPVTGEGRGAESVMEDVPLKIGDEAHFDEMVMESDMQECTIRGICNSKPEVNVAGGDSSVQKTGCHGKNGTVFVGPETGVQVMSMSDIHYWKRGCMIDEKRAAADAAADMELEELELCYHNNVDVSVEVYDNSSDVDISGAKCSEEGTADQVCDVGDDGEAGACGNGDGGAVQQKRWKHTTVYTCNRCLRRYRTRRRLDEHIESCEIVMMDKKTVSSALRIASDTIFHADEKVIYSRADKNPVLCEVDVDVDRIGLSLNKGWAQKPKRGCGLGTNNVAQYEQFIRDMFLKGNANHCSKMSAAAMRLAIRNEFPQEFIIPTEYQITSVITKLTRQFKIETVRRSKQMLDNVMEVNRSLDVVQEDREDSGVYVPRSVEVGVNDECADGGSHSHGNNEISKRTLGQQLHRRGIQPEYLDIIDTILEQSPTLAPRHVKFQLLENVKGKDSHLPDDFPTHSQIINRIGIVKRRLRKGARN